MSDTATAETLAIKAWAEAEIEEGGMRGPKTIAAEAVAVALYNKICEAKGVPGLTNTVLGKAPKELAFGKASETLAFGKAPKELALGKAPAAPKTNQ